MASSVILQEKFWEAKDFPRGSFYHLEGGRNLFHAKIMVVREKDSEEINDSTLLYFGSHNFSPSAWGNL